MEQAFTETDERTETREQCSFDKQHHAQSLNITTDLMCSSSFSARTQKSNEIQTQHLDKCHKLQADLKGNSIKPFWGFLTGQFFNQSILNHSQKYVCQVFLEAPCLFVLA